MRRRVLLLFVLLLAVAMVVGPVSAGVETLGGSGNELGGLVFVELTGKPLADGGSEAALDKEHAAFRKAVSGMGIAAKERYEYSTLFNGFSLEIPSSQWARLASVAGVKALWPVVEYPRPELVTSTDLIRAPEVYEELGFDGSGVLVGLIDTGIDYNHPDLGGGFGPGKRVVGGYDFVGDAFNPPTNPIPVPDEDPMDVAGHGTHVAGIIGANGGIKGVAPGVSFLALKVFGTEGPTLADVMLAAMERALAGGAQVVNMSIGAAYQWPQYPTAVGSDRLVNKGVVVVCSQGNNGTLGQFAGGAPGLGSKVLSVASWENTHSRTLMFRLPDETPIGYLRMTFAPPLPTEGVSPEVVHVGLGSSDADYEGLDVTGKVVLAKRGTTSFADKVGRAQAFGAAYALIYNNVTGFFSGTLGVAGPWIPAAGLSKEGGEAIVAAIAASTEPVVLTWTDESMAFPNPSANAISGFSSWGPSPDLALKPDITAPGGSIFSTYPLALGKYASLNGTSMSSPHVVGAAALLLQAYPRLSPMAVGSLLRSTAVPQLLSPTGSALLPVHRQGGGMADVFAAVTSGARVEPGKVSLGEVSGPSTFTLTLENTRKTTVTYTLTHVPALGTTNSLSTTIQYVSTLATLAMPATVELAAGGKINIEITVTPPEYAAELLFGGYVCLEPGDGGPALTVPYFGFLGDYPGVSLLGSNPYALPWLASFDGTNYYKKESMTIDPDAGDLAYVIFNLARQAQKVRLEVIGDPTGKLVFRVLDQSYFPRNSALTAFFALSWDGSGKKGIVPEGMYRLRLSVLKPLGDDENPDDWEVWISGPIEVKIGP